MITICHLWPSISPWNIWDLPYGVWVGFAQATDDYHKAMKEQQRG